MTTSRPATALVTGASSRIGSVIARGLAQAGWSLALHAHEGADRVEILARDLGEAGCRCKTVIADLTDSATLPGLMAGITQALGPIDVLVNNASIFEDDGMGSLSDDLFNRHMAIHVRAPLLLAQLMSEALPDGRDGLIVNLIDQRVWKLTPQALTYSISKGALWDATRRMAQALAPRIRVNGVGPGPSFRNERQSEAEFARQTRSVLLEHGPAPEEFARTVLYLWECRSITGQMIALDGGQHLAWRTPDVVDVGE
ncbi:SDR family oxidoreductase [Roseibium aestuarii]|uniref:SDR family oxidoreductase n=1 Tax=Roseibium aestuarii TaxID=2600299 RepID=A0ABW4JX16_9HYPH|nr:SDR family oxidoreductase [Roseibium aestuarii]